MSAFQTPTLCMVENRPHLESAVRILVASIDEYAPNLQGVLFMPDASEAFEKWLCDRPRFTIDRNFVPGGYGSYDVKPAAMLELLDRGYDNILWVDTDIVVAKGFQELVCGLEPDSLAVTEELLGDFLFVTSWRLADWSST